MLTPSEVIDKARNLHPSFTGERHPDAVLADELESMEQELLPKVARVYSDELRQVETVSLPLATFGDGYAFPDHVTYYNGLLYWSEDDWPYTEFNIEPEEHAPDPSAFPSGYFQGDTLFLFGREGDWDGYDRIEIPYVPAASTIDLEADADILLPDEAMPAARYRLAEFMAGRHDGSSPAPDVGYFRTRAEDAEEDLLDGMQEKGSAQVGKVRDVRRKRT